MHSAVARDNDVCKQPVILQGRQHTNLCLQAETDMITTDGDVKMEDQILMLYSSQSLVSLLFKFCHAFHAFTCLYTYSSNHSTLL